jgi:hypothetical protein
VLRANSLAAQENVALWHERDISQSSVERVILPDSCLALDYMLALFTQIVRGLVVYPDRMLANMRSRRRSSLNGSTASTGWWGARFQSSESRLAELAGGCSDQGVPTISKLYQVHGDFNSWKVIV